MDDLLNNGLRAKGQKDNRVTLILMIGSVFLFVYIVQLVNWHNTEKIETKDSWISLVDICHRLLSTAFLCTLSPDDPDDTFLNYIKTQGVIKESDDEVSVELPMESINIEVRRAALDANPGYLAWQQRRLILNFIE